jgi:tetratricopeptide (TPR) repeat protein
MFKKISLFLLLIVLIVAGAMSFSIYRKVASNSAVQGREILFTKKYKTAERLLLSEQYAEAEKILSELLEKEPKNTSFLSMMGTAFLGENDFVSAEKTFRKYVALRPADMSGYYNLYRVYYKQKKYSEALVWLKQAVNLLPSTYPYPIENWVKPIVDLSELYFVTGDIKNTKEGLRAASEELQKHVDKITDFTIYLSISEVYEYLKDGVNSTKALKVFLNNAAQNGKKISYAKGRLADIAKGKFLVVTK